MDIVLIAGIWLDGSAWDDVVPELERLGHRAIPLTLPGQGDGDTAATYDDQVGRDPRRGRRHRRARRSSSATRPPCTLAWVAADRRPDEGGARRAGRRLPNDDGETYFGFFEPVDGVVPFPGWEPFEGPDSDDMSPELKASVAAGAHRRARRRHPGHRPPHRRAPLRRAGDDDLPGVQPRPRRRSGSTAATSPSSPTPTSVDFVDIDSGHWPMFTQPAALAALIDEARAASRDAC